MPKSAKTKKTKSKVNYNSYFLHYSYCLAVIVLLTIIGINLNKFLDTKKVLGVTVDVTPLQAEKIYWQNISNANPSYIDAYLQLAKVDVELGNSNEATEFIKKALMLNPNSSKITSVQKALGL